MRIPYKIKYSFIAAIIIPCFGRIALIGSGVEYEIHRYTIPLVVGAIMGFLIGYFLDKWSASMAALEKTNKQLMNQAKKFNTANYWHFALFKKSHSIILVSDPATGKIIDANPQASSFYGYPEEKLKQMSLHDINAQDKHLVTERMLAAQKETRKVFYTKHKLANGETKDVEIFSGAINIDNTPLLLSFVQDITELNRLRGILSICSHCKKIRDKKGGWINIETFIECNSAANFSHGLCSTCIDELYPDHSTDPRIKALKAKSEALQT
ncbi:MAG: hypothetical protein COA36_05670 [Desulfotalea sp.]|nr:MAG: hypothetical protein COA36_05670 [Desulfotalea sp.]